MFFLLTLLSLLGVSEARIDCNGKPHLSIANAEAPAGGMSILILKMGKQIKNLIRNMLSCVVYHSEFVLTYICTYLFKFGA